MFLWTFLATEHIQFNQLFEKPPASKTMGCSSSVYSGVIMKRRSSASTVSSVDVLESDNGYFGKIAKRYGHPSYYKMDGYDLGLRFKVRGVLQSYFVGCSRSTGEKVTIKEFHLPFYPTSDNSIMTEVLFLSKLSHRSLPRFKEIFITDISVFLVSEYVDQQRLVHVLRSLSHDETKQVMKGLFDVLQFLHEKKVVVRDLTPGNISFRRLPATQGGGIEIKIADLSMAIEMGSSSSSSSVLADHPLFDWPMVPYSSPEALKGEGCGAASDMWSCGVLLFQLLSKGDLPFNGEQDHILLAAIFKGDFDDDGEVWEEVSEEARQLMDELLSVCPQDRPSAKEASKRPWMTMNTMTSDTNAVAAAAVTTATN